MGSASYKKFLTVDIQHNFYVSGKSADFDLAPTPFTAEKMLNQKIVFRTLTNGFKMLYRAVSGVDPTPFSTIEDGIYSFAMILKNPLEFLNITELTDISSVTYKSGNIIYFRNTTPANNTIPKHEILNRLLPAKFSYDFNVTAIPADTVKLQIRSQSSSGTIVYTSDPLIESGNDTFRADVDLSKFAPGKYVIEFLKNADPAVSIEKVYIDSRLSGKNIFGIIDIEFKSSSISFTSFVGLNPFEPEFERRETRWKYYVVNKRGEETFDLVTANFTPHIFDTNSDSPYGTIDFGSPVSVPNINGFPAVSILSDDPIPFYEKAKPGLQLRRADDSDIMSDLPNPNRVSSAKEAPNITPIFVFI